MHIFIEKLYNTNFLENVTNDLYRLCFQKQLSIVKLSSYKKEQLN